MNRKRAKARLKEGRNRVRWAAQRVVRGWDDTVLWSIDNHLAETLGAQLQRFGAGTYAFCEGYPLIEWREDLIKHGKALSRYARDQYSFLDDEKQMVADAKEALHWVADNLEALWD